MKRRTSAVLGSLLGCAALVASGPADAQEIGIGLNYDPRVPVGGLRNLVPNAAFAGLQGKWEYYLLDRRLALGFDIEYHYFQTGGETTTIPFQNGAATAAFTRYAYFFTGLATARYFPLGTTPSAVRPYAEIGVGATSATGAVLASDLSRRSNTGGFVAQPAIGVLWAVVSHIPESTLGPGTEEEYMSTAPRRPESMFGLSASLAWAVTTADVLGAQNVSYLGVQVGIYAKP